MPAHSPVVTPARAAAIVAGMMFSSPGGHAAQLGQRGVDGRLVTRGAPGAHGLTLLGLDRGSTVRIPPSAPWSSGEGSVSV